jgi:hypothetical protein
LETRPRAAAVLRHERNEFRVVGEILISAALPAARHPYQ